MKEYKARFSLPVPPSTVGNTWYPCNIYPIHRSTLTQKLQTCKSNYRLKYIRNQIFVLAFLFFSQVTVLNYGTNVVSYLKDTSYSKAGEREQATDNCWLEDKNTSSLRQSFHARTIPLLDVSKYFGWETPHLLCISLLETQR